MSLINFSITLILLSLSGLSPSQAVTLSDKEFESERTRAVEIARAGQYDQGLVMLRSLLDQTTNQYPLQRDIVIITSWKEDCPAALELYEPIRTHTNQEAYLIGPVGRCLYDVGEEQEAIRILQAGIIQWPDDEELKEILANITAAPEPEPPYISTAYIDASLGANQSDQGNQEWFLETRYSRRFRANFLYYARFLTVRADDPQFETGDLNRVGVGGRYDFLDNWAVAQDFSFDVKRSNEGGSTTTLFYTLPPLWTFDLSYASFAEDLPLRAKAQSIDSDRASASADFHTDDYLWTWSASVSLYDFSDGNNRNAFFTAGSYAYVLKDEREQRISLELYRTTNTALNTVYYSPEEDLTLTVTHILDIVYDSRFKRHVDHFYVYLGNYIQKGEDTKGTWGLRFEQDYDFDDINSFSFSVAYDDRVYDGTRESEKSFYLSYKRNL